MKIYFDMDGVLVNFDAMRPNDTDLNHPSADLSPEKRAQKKRFWQQIEQEPNFWHDIPSMPNIEHLLSVACALGEIFVLSKTPGAHHFINGEKYVEYVANEKRRWIADHMGKYFDTEHTIICDGAKGELIRPSKTDILIDDRPENITEWESHGGTGIVFTNAIDVAQKLQDL